MMYPGWFSVVRSSARSCERGNESTFLVGRFRHSLLDPQPDVLELRFHDTGPARRTNAVAEAHVGMRTDVALNLMPVILIIPNSFTVGTDREKPLKLFHLLQSGFEFFDAPRQLQLQFHNLHTHIDTCGQFFGIERLRHIIVRAGAQPFYDIFLASTRGEQDQIHRFQVRQGAEAAAHFQPIDFRHQPIENGQPRNIRTLKGLPGLGAVHGGHDLVAAFGQCGPQRKAGNVIIVCDQNLHATLSTPASASSNRLISRRKSTYAAWQSVKSEFRPKRSNRSAAAKALSAPKLPTDPFNLWAARSSAELSRRSIAASISLSVLTDWFVNNSISCCNNVWSPSTRSRVVCRLNTASTGSPVAAGRTTKRSSTAHKSWARSGLDT